MASDSAQIPNGITRLLLVEGDSDKEFFIQLKKHHQPNAQWHILTYGGTSNFRTALKAFMSQNNFKNITHLGIVRDADFSGGAFQSIQTTLREQSLPAPNISQQFLGDMLKVGVYIMPDAGSSGMLETLIWEALQDDEIASCVYQYFECLATKGIVPKQERIPKAHLRAYVTALMVGKSVDEKAPSKDKDKNYYSDVYKMSWWTWDKPEFDGIKAFLAGLLAE